MAEERGFKQNFIRSFIIGAVISFVAYMIITGADWELLGFEFGGGPKPDAAIEEAARAAAITETVTIDGKTWMKRNLNVWTGSSWCYENNPDNCAEYGRLYTWRAANRACASLGNGWRLATVYDWDALINAAGGRKIAVPKLKSQTGWLPVDRGDTVMNPVYTDDFGFSALPGGKRYCKDYYRSSGSRTQYLFGGIGYYGAWWTATTASGDGGKAYEMGINYNDEIMSEFYSLLYSPYKTDGYSVRCVKD